MIASTPKEIEIYNDGYRTGTEARDLKSEAKIDTLRSVLLTLADDLEKNPASVASVIVKMRAHGAS